MKIALCAFDYFQPVLQTLRDAEVQVAKVWSFEVDNETFSFNRETERFAAAMGAPFSLRPIDSVDIAELEAAGTDALIVAGYRYKLPIPAKSRMRFINTHGSLLPEGRGPWPQPWIILQHRDCAGVTLHSMTNAWDSGDIVLQEKIVLHPEEDVESLSCRTARLGGELVGRLVRNFEEIWERRAPMHGKGSYWKMPRIADRVFDPRAPRDVIERVFRAFGTYAVFRDEERGETWTIGERRIFDETHQEEPGRILTRSNHHLLVAITGGVACLNIVSKIE
jgi:methionyl-tRNA formyltransferase